MTDPDVATILHELKRLERRIESIAPASEWVFAEAAATEYGVHRDTLRKLARRGLITRSENLPVRYSRSSLDRYFIGVGRFEA